MLLREILKESMPALLLCGIGEILASSMLMDFQGPFSSIPGLIMTVPAIIDLRGDVSGALGSRLGSAVHLGIIGEKRLLNRECKTSIRASLLLSLLMSIFAAVLAFSIQSAISGAGAIVLLKLTIIASATGVITGVILAGVSLLIVMLSFRYGYDPDNVITPGLATIGDVITIAMLFLITMGVEAIW
jgi:mgtE-like transporter